LGTSLFTTIQWQIIIVANLEKWWILACPVQFYFGLFFGNFSNFSTYIFCWVFFGVGLFAWLFYICGEEEWGEVLSWGVFILADQTHKFLASPSQAQWQRAGRTFTCTPLGLEPRPFLEVPRSQRGGYTTKPSPLGCFHKVFGLY